MDNPVCLSALFYFKRCYEMKDYMTISEASEKWGIGNRRITTLCKTGRIPGAEKFGRTWAIPAGAEKPADRRIVTGLYVKSGE